MTEPDASLTAEPWRLRYWSIFVGQALSLIGSAVTQFVLLWWIAETTGSVSALAMAGVAALMPQALLAPLGGVLADRYSRRLIMILTDLVSALCMVVLISLFLSGAIEIWHAYVMMFVRSAMQAFQAPAAQASAAMLVPAEFLPRAAGLNQAMMGVMTVAAAPLGALAIGIMPIGWALSIDVVTAVLGIVPLLLFAIPQPSRERSADQHMWSDFKEGVALVWRDPGLLHIYAILAGVVLMIMPSFTLAPLLVLEHFQGGPPHIALMEGLTGLAMILGGLIVAAMAPKRRVAWFIWGFAISCFLLAATAIPGPEQFWMAVAAWALSGAAFAAGNAPLVALLQTAIPNQLQGRAFSILNMVMGLAAPVSLVAVSALGETVSVRWLFIFMGIAGGLVALAGLISKPLRRLDAAEA